MQESHNSIANVLELRLSRTNHQYIVAIFIIYTVPISYGLHSIRYSLPCRMVATEMITGTVESCDSHCCNWANHIKKGFFFTETGNTVWVDNILADGSDLKFAY